MGVEPVEWGVLIDSSCSCLAVMSKLQARLAQLAFKGKRLQLMPCARVDIEHYCLGLVVAIKGGESCSYGYLISEHIE